MQSTNDPYIVRQSPGVFIAFIALGVLIAVGVWFVQASDALVMKLLVCALGVLAILVGIVGWQLLRVGLIADRQGVWIAGYSLRKKLVPWNTIVAVKKRTFDSDTGPTDDVLLGLASVDAHPARGHRELELMMSLAKEGDDESFAIPLVLGHEEWDWNPDEFIEVARRSIGDCAETTHDTADIA